MVVKHQHAAEPQHDDNHHRAQKLAHGVCHLLACVDAAYVVAVFRVYLVKAPVHLLLGAEGLDDAQAAQGLLHLAHGVAPQALCLDGLLLELAAHIP